MSYPDFFLRIDAWKYNNLKYCALDECELLDQDLEWIETQEFEYYNWVVFLLGYLVIEGGN